MGSRMAVIASSAADRNEDGKRRPRRRRVRAAAIAVTLIAAGGAAGITATDAVDVRKKDGAALASAASSTALAKVTRGTLSARTQQNGTLGYAGDHPVVNHADGTVTQLPAVGEAIRQGQVLYRVNAKPVILLKGSVPAYRELSRGMEGADVQQLNAALVALGYATEEELDPRSDYFSRATRSALKELQDAVGLEETGRLTPGQAVFLPVDELRVTKVEAMTGGLVGPGGLVMRASSTRRHVTVALNAGQQSSVKPGDKVLITLPNGKTTDGVVSSVGKVATKTEQSMTVDVLIEPSDAKATGELDQAPVQIAIVSETVNDVLSVPVDALLARAGGGYAVEVVDEDGKHRLVPVTTGLFDDSAGTVQVTGEGLSAGQNVVVPAS
ncbi:efflux RND transporter periplasmic adaptor subunit [Streptomyces sp. NPDC056401]|uniref:efflux RND transporter periplasmic adaptor subunit n=1 Tax=Streptomyces sp. NPDC056401 TaxID=3345809 RepID=UPI0035D73EB2